ncbi:iron uptake protein [Parahaliea aestuarii]|uniref:Iron uptake protein n=1 Tax=Parahaliea aestuarii TaxID=1852021 RepID=A0A5C8ZTC3_9GAMM|nr:iron uptake protein [Parahaliea aestuarii]TXS90541.1 iron uptake protein [Parahaliea aestuarii]
MSATASEQAPLALAILSRIAASLLGGYAFLWGASSLGIAGLVALGMAYDEARTLCMIIAFLAYLVIFLWVWAARNMLRVWILLLAGGGLMSAAALVLQQQLIAGA